MRFTSKDLPQISSCFQFQEKYLLFGIIQSASHVFQALALNWLGSRYVVKPQLADKE